MIKQLLHDCNSEVLIDEHVVCESERLLINSNTQFFNYIMARINCNLMRWWWCPFCTRPACWVWIFMVLAQRNNNLWVDMSSHSDTLSRFQVNQYFLFLLNVASSVEKQQIPILYHFVWPDPGVEPTIYHIQGKHANHYTTDVVYDTRYKYIRTLSSKCFTVIFSVFNITLTSGLDEQT